MKELGLSIGDIARFTALVQSRKAEERTGSDEGLYNNNDGKTHIGGDYDNNN
jgi:hypothetical protein